MKKHVWMLASGLLMAGSVWAQEIKFENPSHEFGEVREGDIAAYEFKFTNVGSKPLILSNVQPSCGCTTPSYPKEPIMPGKSAVIKAEYNSANRPGVFNKSIAVNSNATNGQMNLILKGIVVKKDDFNQYTTAELESSPVAKLGRDEFQLGKVELNRPALLRIPVTNTGKSVLKIQDLSSTCFCTSYKIQKTDLAPGESGQIEVTYTPRIEGKQTETLYITTSDLKNKVQKVSLKAEVVTTLVQPSMMKEGKAGVPFK